VTDRQPLSEKQIRIDLCTLFGFYLDREGDAFASTIAVVYRRLFPKGPFPFGMTDRLAALKAASKPVKPDFAFEVTCWAWDDNEEDGGHWTRQREGIVVAKSTEEAVEKLKAAGYQTVEDGLRTYYEPDSFPTQIIGDPL
jgi:hypothetical protein